MKVHNNFPVPSYWKDLWKVILRSRCYLRRRRPACLFEVPLEERNFRKLISSDALKKANLIDPLSVFFFSLYVLIFHLMSFPKIVFLIAWDRTTVELGFGGGPLSTPVVETDDNVEIMYEDKMNPFVGENVVAPQGRVRAQVLPLVRRRACVLLMLGMLWSLRMSKAFQRKV